MVLQKNMDRLIRSTQGRVYEWRYYLKIYAMKCDKVGVYSLISFIPNLSNSLSILAILFNFKFIYPDRMTLKMGKNYSKIEV